MTHPLPRPLLQVQGLVKRFGGLAATDGCDLVVAEGEIHALIGPNGAGKTTLIHQLSGALAPDAGRIVFDGQDLTAWPIHRRVRAGLARSFQITSVFRSLPVHDNLALALQAQAPRPWHPWARGSADRERRARAEALAARIGLAHHLDTAAGALSHAEQRQLELGLALATGARLLLLDEISEGLAPVIVQKLADMILGLKARGYTIVLVEQNFRFAAPLADRFYVMEHGAIVREFRQDELQAHMGMLQEFLGV